MRLPGVGAVPENPELASGLLREAVSLGAKVIDTADFYGDGVANRLIAKALRPYPGDLIISTKVGARRGINGRPEPAATPDQIRSSVERNLQTLDLDRLDLVFLRLPGGPLADSGVPIQISMECLAGLQTDGLIKHIGLSNASTQQIRNAQAVAPIEAVQNACFVGHHQSAEVVRLCDVESIPFFAYFPLGMGTLIQEKVDLSAFAATHRASNAQIALAWLLALSPVVVPIPGTSNIEHLRENMAASKISLSKDELDVLSGVV